MQRVKMIMRRDLKLGSDIVIDDNMPFFGSDADIDSLDILLLMGSIEREFGIRVASEEVGRTAFQNVGTLADFLVAQLGMGKPPAVDARAPDQSNLLSRLPHGQGFRFISHIIRVQDGADGEAIWSLSGEEPFFQSHFPGKPVVPGVLIAEALAQLSGLVKHVPEQDGRLAHIDVRFEGSVQPPAEIRLRSRLIRTLASLTQYDVEASLGSAVIARGSITVGWLPRPPTTP